MHPTVQHADLVLVAPLKRHVRREEIVLVPLGPRLMLHRVVTIRGTDVITRGDARVRDDAPTQTREIVARAIGVRRGDRVAALTFTTRFGISGLVRFLLRETRRRARSLTHSVAALRAPHRSA